MISLVGFRQRLRGRRRVAVARAVGKRLWGVRLDTSGTLVDQIALVADGHVHADGRRAAARTQRAWGARCDNGFGNVKIVVSGGFDAAKIRVFEDEDVPVDAYAVGSAFFEGNGKYDFTADIVAIERDGAWVECHKVGRPERANPRLAHVL